MTSGTQIEHFEVLSLLGKGGMGEVYQARDSRLNRHVAIKILPAEFAGDQDRLWRFEHEARTVAGLNHPNIVVLYDLGVHQGRPFIVTELLEGETLRHRIRQGPIPFKTATEFGVQIAEGLAAAHEQGVIHRDLKPENIFVTRDLRLKILDFGLAKLKRGSKERTVDWELATALDETEPGLLMGTAAYMSPEQVRGVEVDLRSDIFAVGTILYEMLMGRNPFHRGSRVEIMHAILKEDPLELAETHASLPSGFDRVIYRCLEKRPEKRFQSAADLAFAIQNSFTPAPSPIFRNDSLRTSILPPVPRDSAQKSVAVLPFVNMTPDHDNDYLSDGITEDLIAALSEAPDLRVPARTSSFAFKGKSEDVRCIGQQLNVSAVLEGSVQKSGNRLRIRARLVNVDDGYHLWSERFDREMADVFAIQDEITRAIVSALKLQFVVAEKTGQRTDSTEAYQLNLKGRFHWNQRGTGLLKSLHYFELALLEDPKYASALAGLADCYSLLSFYGYLPPRQAMPRSKAAIEKALSLAPDSAEAHASRAFAAWTYDWDWQVAEEEFQRAIELKPNYPVVWYWHGTYLATSRGQTRPAEASIRRAADLDPLSPLPFWCLALLKYFEREYEQTVQFIARAIELNPNFVVAHVIMGQGLIKIGRPTEGIEHFQRAVDLSNQSVWPLGWLGFAFAATGNRSKAAEIRSQLIERSAKEFVRSYSIALIDLGLADFDSAIELLGRAYEERDVWASMLAWDPTFESLANHPAFKALLNRSTKP